MSTTGLFTDENTDGFSADELDEMNSELVARLKTDEYAGFEERERIEIISGKIIEKYQ